MNIINNKYNYKKYFNSLLNKIIYKKLIYNII